MSESMYALKKHSPKFDFISWMETIFENQEKFGNKNTLEKSKREIVSYLGNLIEDNHFLSSESFINEINNGSCNMNTRVSWKV